jgi:ABC-type antimicrobial peptide transport system permease subunit
MRRDVLIGVLRDAGILALSGLAGGCAAAMVLTRFLATLLFEVRPADPATLTAIAALLTAVALVSSYLPARRAASVDPAAALRHD